MAIASLFSKIFENVSEPAENFKLLKKCATRIVEFYLLPKRVEKKNCLGDFESIFNKQT